MNISSSPIRESTPQFENQIIDRVIRESPPQFENRIMARGVALCVVLSTKKLHFVRRKWRSEN